MRDAFFIVFVNNFEWFPVNFMPFNIKKDQCRSEKIQSDLKNCGLGAAGGRFIVGLYRKKIRR
jgi:hypothetical protein